MPVERGPWPCVEAPDADDRVRTFALCVLAQAVALAASVWEASFPLSWEGQS